MSVLIDTSLGELVVDLFTDDCPLACENFLKLCKLKYYNNVIFHKVEKNFIAHTGDPTGTGTGGESVFFKTKGPGHKYFPDEIVKTRRHNKVGLLAMANPVPGQNGSAFYITLSGRLDYLDDKHTIFGEVAEGLDVLVRLNSVFVDKTSRPYQNVRIRHTSVLDDPFPDPPTLPPVPPSPPLAADKFDEGRLRDDEAWDDAFRDMTPAEVQRAMRKREAKVNAELLVLLGDLPDAEVKPPDNVLFVCKLNPVTEADDLDLIFSQCGKVVKCDVIKDKATGKSLGYGFIEFETAAQCERARERMDGAVIDDRKIMCDFSQSVSTVWNKFSRGENMGALPPVGAHAGTGGRAEHKRGDSKHGGDRARETDRHREGDREYHRRHHDRRDERSGRDYDHDRGYNRDRDPTRDRDSTRDRDYGRDRSRDRDRDRDRGRDYDRDRGRGRDYDRDRDREYDRARGRDDDRGRNYERSDRERSDRECDRGRDRDYERERDHYRSRHDDYESRRSNDRDRRSDDREGRGRSDTRDSSDKGGSNQDDRRSR